MEVRLAGLPPGILLALRTNERPIPCALNSSFSLARSYLRAARGTRCCVCYEKMSKDGSVAETRTGEKTLTDTIFLLKNLKLDDVGEIFRLHGEYLFESTDFAANDFYNGVNSGDTVYDNLHIKTVRK